MHPSQWATLRAFHELGMLDRLELAVLPVLLGDGIPLSSPETPESHCGWWATVGSLLTVRLTWSTPDWATQRARPALSTATVAGAR